MPVRCLRKETSSITAALEVDSPSPAFLAGWMHTASLQADHKTAYRCLSAKCAVRDQAKRGGTWRLNHTRSHLAILSGKRLGQRAVGAFRSFERRKWTSLFGRIQNCHRKTLQNGGSQEPGVTHGNKKVEPTHGEKCGKRAHNDRSTAMSTEEGC